MVKRGVMREDAKEAMRQIWEREERERQPRKSRAQLYAEAEEAWAEVAAEAEEERQLAALGPEW